MFLMPRHAPPLEWSAEDAASLTAISKSRTEEARTVERARIVLACLEGKENRQVAQGLGVSVPTVSKWRRRFAFWGLRGLLDQPRPGKPIIYNAAFRNRVLALLEQSPPPGMSHWNGPAMAERLGSSVHAVWRVVRREGIYLQRVRSWCVSTDREFAPKAAEIMGLYLNPPVKALVLSVDEKPSLQAIERTSGYLETDSGAVVRALKSTYKRHGTLNLFAALEVGTGQVHAKTTDYKKRGDFLGFLDGVLAELPLDKAIHVILDNYSTHKRNPRLAREVRRAGAVPLHTDCGELAESDRDRVQSAAAQGAQRRQFQEQGAVARGNRSPHKEAQRTRQTVSVGASARSKAASSEIQLLTYAIKH
jgi:transposase